MAQACLLALTAIAITTVSRAQEMSPPRRVGGTVLDEQGRPIASARIRLELCSSIAAPGLFATELLHDPLPVGVSSSKGKWALIFASVHDAFDQEVHGRLALVVEAPGRQAWRELLPNPPRLYDGSDVVLPKLADQDRATIRIDESPPGALVLLRRYADDLVVEGGAPRGERYLIEVPASGELTVHVPILPNPPCVPTTSYFAVTGWTAQYLSPGVTSAPMPIAAGQVLTISKGKQFAAKPALGPTGERHRVARCLHRLADNSLRWFASSDGDVLDDPLLPVVAVELAAAPFLGCYVTWPAPVVLPAAPSRELQFVDQDGKAVGHARVATFRLQELTWNRIGALRPERPAKLQLPTTRGKLTVPEDLGERSCGWVTAPGHAPALVYDLRAVPGDGRVVLRRAKQRITVIATDPSGTPIANARVYGNPMTATANGAMADGIWLTADGNVPRTDENGRCEIWSDDQWPSARLAARECTFDWPEFDERSATLQAIGHQVSVFAARAVDSDGNVVPFANVGYEMWTFAADGSSSGSIFTAMADSRGTLHMFGDARKPPRVSAGEMGRYPKSGGTRLSVTDVVDVVVPRDPLVAVVVPHCSSTFRHFAMSWTGIGRTTGGGVRMRALEGFALLMRWPAALPLWGNDVDQGPPIVVSREQASAQSLHVLDRRTIRRRTPLRLTGDLPHDLSELRSIPAVIAGLRLDAFSQLDSDYLVSSREPDRLLFETRDRHAHELWLLHPDLVPARAVIPAGEAKGDVEVALTTGAACTFVLKLKQPLQELFSHHLIVRRLKARRGDYFAGPLLDPRLSTDAVVQGIELRAPFALPSGTWRVAVMSNGEVAVGVVTVEDARPVRLELTPKR